MRLFFAMLTGALVCVGCSHTEKISDEHSNIKPPAPIIKPTDHQEPETSSSGKTAATGTKIECAVKGDSRILEVRPRGAGCEFAYTKAGQEGVVGSSMNNGLAYCEKSFEKLKERLKGAGFECK